MSAFTDLPDNKIGDSTGERNLFLVFLFFLLWFLGFCFLSHCKIQLDSLIVKLHWKTFSIFNFFHFCLISTPCFEGQFGNLWFLCPTCLDQCGISTPYLYMACGNQGFLHYASLQPAEIVKILIFDGFFLTQTLDLVLGWIFGFDYDLFTILLISLKLLLAIFSLSSFERFGLLIWVSFSYEASFFFRIV